MGAEAMGEGGSLRLTNRRFFPHARGAMAEEVVILGGGNMGTAMAHVFARAGHRVCIREHLPEVVDEIRALRTNSRFLPGVTLHGSVRAVLAGSPPSRDEFADVAVLVVAVPSPFAAPALEQVRGVVSETTVVLNAAKGIDRASGAPMGETICRMLPRNPHAHLAGPAIANEFARGKPAAVVLASPSEAAARRAAGLFQPPGFLATVTADVRGAELAGILKNIYAILLGWADEALPGGRNQEAAILTASLQEMVLLGCAMGGAAETFHGVAGLGDLVATALSHDSHNRKFGRLLGRGHSIEEAETEMGLLPEGARTAAVACAWAEDRDLRLPLAGFVRRLTAGSARLPATLADLLAVEAP